MPFDHKPWHLLGFDIGRKSDEIFRKISELYPSWVLHADLLTIDVNTLSELEQKLLLARLMLTHPGWKVRDFHTHVVERLKYHRRKGKSFEQLVQLVAKMQHLHRIAHDPPRFVSLDQLDIMNLSCEDLIALVNQISNKASRKNPYYSKTDAAIQEAMYARYDKTFRSNSLSDQEIRAMLCETQSNMVRKFRKPQLVAKFANFFNLDPITISDADFPDYLEWLHFKEPFMQGNERYPAPLTGSERLHCCLHKEYIRIKNISLTDLRKRLSQCYRHSKARVHFLSNAKDCESHRKVLYYYGFFGKPFINIRKSDLDEVDKKKLISVGRKLKLAVVALRDQYKTIDEVAQQIDEMESMVYQQRETARRLKVEREQEKQSRENKRAVLKRKREEEKRMRSEIMEAKREVKRRKKMVKEQKCQEKRDKMNQQREAILGKPVGPGQFLVPEGHRREYQLKYQKWYDQNRRKKTERKLERGYDLIRLMRLDPMVEERYKVYAKTSRDKNPDRDRGIKASSWSRSIKQEIVGTFTELLENALDIE